MFSMTMEHIRLTLVIFSLSPLESMGQRMESVGASTDTTKVVCISFSMALTVSEGLHMAATTAGMADLTSGLRFVLQHSRIVLLAHLETWALVSQTMGVILGRIFGSRTLMSRGLKLASWASLCKAFSLILHSVAAKALKRTGTTMQMAWVFTRTIMALEVSSAASRMLPELWAEQFNTSLRRGMMKGSALVPTLSQRARTTRREPSRAFVGGLGWERCSLIVFTMPIFLRLSTPKILMPLAKSAAAPPLLLVSLAV
mmetsp:Transcript_23666/g.49299  ORF Transcript_23666/g.49299 Transcript_23666/m.49299 type:complete len:257 (+) Transcript_23666:535-1305(+)